MLVDAPNALLGWYDVHARRLPWRAPPGAPPADPYRVWLSEIMLQQTTVAAAAPYFARFTQSWPDVAALAAADEGEVMRAWAGLGYYARARNLIACARIVAADKRGCFPDNEEGLRALPGIGLYTAAAIAAIAFERRAVVVDGNVERVVARLHAVETPLPAARPILYALTDAITPAERAGDFAQAMMDLGATICTPRRPACALCPLRSGCAAGLAGTAELYPVKAPKRAQPIRHGTAFWLERDDRVLLRRRSPKGLLGGMLALPTGPWTTEPPGLADAPADARWQLLEEGIAHTFTHFHLRLALACAEGAAGDPQAADVWWPIGEIGTAGLPTLFAKGRAPRRGEANRGARMTRVGFTGAAIDPRRSDPHRSRPPGRRACRSERTAAPAERPRSRCGRRAGRGDRARAPARGRHAAGAARHCPGRAAVRRTRRATCRRTARLGRDPRALVRGDGASTPPRAVSSPGTTATASAAIVATRPRRSAPAGGESARAAGPSISRASIRSSSCSPSMTGASWSADRRASRRAAIPRSPASSSPANRSRRRSPANFTREAGIAVTNIRYLASQPWPFPSQLMIACLADAADDRLTIDTTELEDARWVTRAEVRAALAGGAGRALRATAPARDRADFAGGVGDALSLTILRDAEASCDRCQRKARWLVCRDMPDGRLTMGSSIRFSHLTLMLACGFASGPMSAQDAASGETTDEIVVTGTRTSTLDLQRLLKAQGIFRSGRSVFAPTSVLLFQLKPGEGIPLAGMTLELQDGREIIPVAIDGEGRFSLPDLPKGRWELVHNRGRGRMAVRALVLSAGANEADRPLGDLRLQCRVGWELKKSGYSFLARGGFDALGGCASNGIAFYFITPQPVAGATIKGKDGTQNLPIRADRKAYRAPLGDKAFSNEARVRISYDRSRGRRRRVASSRSPSK